MSKELTEKWKNGKLFGSYYYVHIKNDGLDYFDIDRLDEATGEFDWHPDEYIFDVLSEVPSYDEIQQAIALIKDGRFVEALKLLEGK